MLGSKLPLRLARGVPQVYARAHTLARPPTRVAAPSPKFVFQSQRAYATPGRPKGAVGEPTRTVKRAVKRAAADKTTATASKPKSKPKTAASKTPKPKKSKPAKKAPKELTEEEKAKATVKAERAAVRLRKAEVKDLKKLALQPPKDLRTRAHVNAWAVFAGARTKESLRGVSTSLTDSRERMKATMADNSAAYKALSPAEHEHYNHLANERSAEKTKQFKAWIETHTPDEIRIANQARRKLRNKLTTEQARAWRDLVDERLVKRAITPYAFFFRERRLSGDFRNIAIGDGSRLVASEWKALSDSEKQKYSDLHIQDMERFRKEYLEVYGHSPESASLSTSATASDV